MVTEKQLDTLKEYSEKLVKVQESLRIFTVNISLIAGTVASFSIQGFESSIIKTKLLCTLAIILLLILIIYATFYLAQTYETEHNRLATVLKMMLSSVSGNPTPQEETIIETKEKLDRNLDLIKYLLLLALFLLFLSFFRIPFISEVSQNFYAPATTGSGHIFDAVK